MRLVVFLFFLFTYFFNGDAAFSQTLKFKIADLPDTTIYLVRYYGPGLYMIDTVTSEKGVVVFDATNLPTGLYAVAFPDNTYFEVVYNKENVSLKIGDKNNAIGTTKVKSSEENKVFYDYAAFFSEQSQKIYALNEKYAAYKPGTYQYDTLVMKVDSINLLIRNRQEYIFKTYPDYFVTEMIWLTYRQELPDYPRDQFGLVTDSSYIYNYYIEHFWDSVDFSNKSLVYSAVYANKLNTYFSKDGLIQHPDTILKYTDILLGQMDQTDTTNDLFKYTLHHIIYKYDTTRIVGMDRVFWHLTEYYYCPPNNKAWWVDEAGIKKMCDYNERIENILIGNYAMPLILTDSTQKKWISLYDIVADYTVLWFWSPTCGHCKTETPLLQILYERKLKERNIEVLAIGEAASEEDFKLWKDFIQEKNLTFPNVALTPEVFNQAMKDPRPLLEFTTIESLNYPRSWDVYSTPKVFLLDKDKKIIYKDISLVQLEILIDYFTGHESDEKILN